MHRDIGAPDAAPATGDELVTLPMYRGIGATAPAASNDEPEEALLSLLRLPQDATLAMQLCMSAWLPNGVFALVMLAKVRLHVYTRRAPPKAKSRKRAASIPVLSLPPNGCTCARSL